MGDLVHLGEMRIEPVAVPLPTTLDKRKGVLRTAAEALEKLRLSLPVLQPTPVTQLQTAAPSWLDQELVAGVSNKWLVGGGVGAILLLALMKPKRRRR